MISTAMSGRLALLLACGFVGLASCSPEPAVEQSPPAAALAPPATPQQVIAEVRLALTERDYGRAATRAREAQLSFPSEPQIHLIAAEAEAWLGNGGNAAAAFQRAIDAGLIHPDKALANAAFDNVRNSEPFSHLRTVYASAQNDSRQRRPVSSGPDRLTAGDVEIITDGSGDYIRAGDVVLDTRH